MNSESEIAVSTPYLVAPSPQAPSPVVTSILEREVLVVDDLVPAEEDVQVRAVLVRAPAVGVIINCWSQTWAMTSQKSLRSIPSQPPRRTRPHLLRFHLSNSNNGGSLLKRRRRSYTRVLWLVSNRYKVPNRYLLPSRAHRFTRHVYSCNSPSYR